MTYKNFIANILQLFFSPQLSNSRIITVKETSGVSDIESEQAPAEYHDLRGVRVSNPQHGSLLIRRQGSEVTKIVY